MIASLILLTASVAQLGATAPAPKEKTPAPPGPSASAKGAQPAASRPQPALARQKIAEGDRKWKEKNYRDASLAYQEAVDAEPGNVEALFKLGNASAVLGYYRQAIDRWNRVLELTSDAAVKKSAEGNIAKAQAKMAKSRPTTPVPARNAYEEGVKQINARNYTGAVDNLTQAIRAQPNLAVAYVARGSAYIGLRRYADAATDYQHAHKLDPTLSAPLYGLAEASRALGRTADARQYYEKYAQSKATDARPELQAKAREQAAVLR